MENRKRYCPHCLTELDGGARRCGACGGDATLENEPHQLPVGTLLKERYRVGGCIGEGGFGITYAGRDTVLALKVAIKEYYPTGIVNRYHTHSLEVAAGTGEKGGQFSEGKRRVLDEARALARFSGEPSIVNVRDTFEANNTAYIVMEFLDGQTLRQVEQEQGPLPFDRVYGYLAPVMDALAKIHRQGLIHRDISPSNLMLLKNDTVKLLDFGTVRAYDTSGERSLSVMLKPGFAPEEQYRSHSAQGPWTDVYGMCASMYRLLTGVTPENAMNRVFEDTLQPPSQLGARIAPAQEQALMRGLAVQAADRIRSMEELRRALSGEDEDEDEERTLYKPRAAETTTPGAVPKYAPRAVAQTPPPQPRSAPQVPGRAAPVPEAPKAAPGPSDGVESGVQPQSRQAGPGRTPRRDRSNGSDRQGRGKKRLALILPIAAAAAVVIAVALFLVLRGGGGNPYRTIGSVSTLRDTEVTEQALKAIARDPETTELDLYDCTLSDSAIRAIGEMARIKSLELHHCTGFTSLDPLAQMDALESLDLISSGDTFIELDGLFTADLPRVEALNLQNCRTQDGGAFLSRFSGLKRIAVSDFEGRLDMENLAAHADMTSITLHGVEAGDSGFAPLAGCESLYQLLLFDTQVGDISWMSPLQRLSTLTLENCGVTRLDGLENHARLSQLDASGNPLEDSPAWPAAKS